VIHTQEALILGKDEVLPVARHSMDKALQDLLTMRAREGAALTEEFRKRNTLLRQLLEKVKKEVPLALEEYHAKLEDRVNQLLNDRGVKLTPEDLIPEVAILAERSDITEEIARFDSHLEQFSSTIESTQPCGRKLEFIVQELFRESNTMGAKSSSTVLNRSIVEIKAEVDRLKEQVVNVE